MRFLQLGPHFVRDIPLGSSGPAYGFTYEDC
jgi:hypothetical protein